LYVPAAQSKQLLALAVAPNFPTTQSVHVNVLPEAVENIPASQAEQTEAPGGEEPDGQAAQVSEDAPTVLLYLPALHKLQL